MKKKIAKMMTFIKDANTLANIPNRPMLGFRNVEKFEGIPKENFPRVNTTIKGKFDIFQSLIDCGSFCDIMYSNLFENMGLEKVSLWPYEYFDLHLFNGTTTRLWGYVEMIVFVGKGKKTSRWSIHNSLLSPTRESTTISREDLLQIC